MGLHREYDKITKGEKPEHQNLKQRQQSIRYVHFDGCLCTVLLFYRTNDKFPNPYILPLRSAAVSLGSLWHLVSITAHPWYRVWR